MLVLTLGTTSLLPTTGFRRQPIALYTSEVCVGHSPGSATLKGYTHPEQPARLEGLLTELRTKWVGEFGRLLQVKEPDADVTVKQLLRVHTRAHLGRLDLAFKRASFFGGKASLDTDTIASAGTRAAVVRAAGLVVAAVDDVFGGERSAADGDAAEKPRRAFVMARPPGHHAEKDSAQGFCFCNNVLVGVAHAQAVHRIGRVAILDFDVHHGNGDEDITEPNPTRLYVSSHEVPNFPGTGEVPGTSGRHGNVLNAPLPANTGSQAFRRVWRQELLPRVREFDPEAIFLSAGFDAHADDPLSSVRLSDDDFAWLTTEVVKIGGGTLPIISVLEGGYNVQRLQRSVRAHLKALMVA
uniref:Histone deacetylase domain-containing protein n=1 Tax=Haptolina brevifila TaxID=156173 RepID=A0A7S2BPN0_9EUKA|mmetsp:Transcript_15219/g.30550  ORF Transcript_15219/g.30550 Transcript_15219/m.30550 type:complete len:354 (+) Transcript_15219:64-1125(+)